MRRILVVAVLLVSGVAYADDPAPKFTYGDKKDVKDVKDVEWNATAEAGVVLTTGNSETTDATAGFHVSRKTGFNKVSAEGSLTYVEAAVKTLDDKNGNGIVDDPSEIQTVDTVTAETEIGKLRYDRFLTDLNSLYIAAIGARDVPAGKDYDLGGQVGYSRHLAKTDTSDTVAEVGYDFTREQPVVGPGTDIHSIRAFLGTKVKMTTGTDLEASGEILTNLNTETLATGESGSPLEDTRFNGHIAISAKIGKSLAAQTSLDVHYDHRPAPLVIKNVMFAPDVVLVAAPMDTIMKFQLIYTFF